MRINTKYNPGDIVYVVVNPDLDKVMVTTITITPNGYYYTVSKGNDTFDVYEVELSLEKTIP